MFFRSLFLHVRLLRSTRSSRRIIKPSHVRQPYNNQEKKNTQDIKMFFNSKTTLTSAKSRIQSVNYSGHKVVRLSKLLSWRRALCTTFLPHAHEATATLWTCAMHNERYAHYNAPSEYNIVIERSVCECTQDGIVLKDVGCLSPVSTSMCCSLHR